MFYYEFFGFRKACQPSTGRPPKSNRIMFNAIYGLLEVAPLGATPKERYGSWEAVYSRFYLWRDMGLLETLFIALNGEADYENLSIDSTVVTAHQQSVGAKRDTFTNS